MRKIFNRTLAIILSLTICISLFGGMSVIMSSAEEAATDDTVIGENILSGLLPSSLYQTQANVTDYNVCQCTVTRNGVSVQSLQEACWGANVHGSISNFPDANILTDGATDTGFTLDNYSGRVTVFVYSLGKEYDINTVKVDFPFAGTRTFQILAGNTRNTLVSPAKNTPVATVTGSSETSFTLDVEAYAVTYIAIAIVSESSANGVGLTEFAAYGKESQDLISGALPTAIYQNDIDSTDLNSDYASGVLNGSTFYSSVNDVSTNPHGLISGVKLTEDISRITDGDVSTRCYYATVPNPVRNTVLIYKLPAVSTVNRITLKFRAATMKTFSIYVGADRDTIFDNEPIVNVVNQSVQTVSYDVSAENAKYIALVHGYDSDYAVALYDYRVFGVQTGEMNLSQTATPVAAYAAGAGTTNYNSTPIQVGSWNISNNGAGSVDAISASEENLNSRITAFERVNDDVYNNSVTLWAQGFQNGDHVVLAYKLNSLTDIKRIGFMGTTSAGLDIYIAHSKASLFHSSSKIGSIGVVNPAAISTIDITDGKLGLYVGFVFSGVNVINDLIIYGDEIIASKQAAVLGGAEPSNTNANEKTKSFYQYLVNVGEQDKILSGAHIFSINTNGSTMEDNYYSWIEKTYGVSPSIVSISKPDLFTDTDKYTEQTDIFVDYYENGAIPMFMGLTDWHSDSTFGGIRYLDNTYEPTTDEQADLAADYLDAFETKLVEWGDFFQSLEAAGVETYIFRPFPEMNTNSFFGDKGNTHFYANFINVWQQMYDYFYNVRGLKGMLIAWAPSGTESNIGPDLMAYYPGDEYVDIIAPTVYSAVSAESAGTLPVANNYEELLATGKPFGFSECSPRNPWDISNVGDCLKFLESLKTTYKAASFFSLWFGQAQHGIGANDNAEAFIASDYLISIQNQVNHQIDMVQPLARATVYSEKTFEGDAVNIAIGSFAAEDLTDVAMASVDLIDGYKITLYAEDNCSGESWVFGKDIADITDMSAKSIKIELAESYTTGDANGSGEIDVRDLVRIKKALVGAAEMSVLAGDLDYSGQVNSADTVILRRYLLGDISSF